MSAMRIITWMCRKRLLADERGDVLVGFILIVGLLFGLFFAGVGFFLLLSWLQFTEMATQAGVRTAVVSDPAVAGLPPFIEANAGFPGQSCSFSSSTCKPLEPISCGPSPSKGGCAGAAFDHIAARIQQIFPVIQDDNIRITYSDSGLGYIGGPPVPLVTVEVVNLEIPVIGAIIDLALRLVGGAGQGGCTVEKDGKKVPALCPIAASMTAEDLNTAGSP